MDYTYIQYELRESDGGFLASSNNLDEIYRYYHEYLAEGVTGMSLYKVTEEEIELENE